MIATLAILVLLVACSALISGSETALFSLTQRQRRSFATSANPFQRTASRLMEHPRRVLATVLIINTAVNVGIFAVSYVSLRGAASASPVVSAAGGIAGLVVVVLFGEVIPKALALAHARSVAPVSAPMIQFLQWATLPLRWLLTLLLIEPLTRLLAPVQADEQSVTADDLQKLMELSARQGVISSKEQDMLESVVALPEIKVRSIMTPRVRIDGVSVTARRSQIRERFHQSGRKKLLAFGRDLDDVRGLLWARDFYLYPDRRATQILRPVRYVPEMINAVQLLDHFRSTRSKFAVVVDEHGGVSGVVALEDILEQIVGHLESAGKPSTDQIIERIDGETYRLSALVSIRPWREALGRTAMLDDVETIGGAVLAVLGRLPRVGESVRLGGLEITVDQMQDQRIEKVLLRISSPSTRRQRS